MVGLPHKTEIPFHFGFQILKYSEVNKYSTIIFWFEIVLEVYYSVQDILVL